MSFQDVWEFAQNHWFIAFVLGLVLFCLLVATIARMGFHFLYVLVIAAAAVIATQTGRSIYFWPFLMGMTTAFAEIISKFDDEPLKALKTLPALLYHVLNGMISVFALYFLALLVDKPPYNLAAIPPMDQLKYAMAAGLGAMLIMRSKLFNIKVGDDNVSFGPEQIINILFRFMESAIGRIRARARRDFIEVRLKNVKFGAAYPHAVMTLKRATRTISEHDLNECLEDLKLVKVALDGLSPEDRTDAEVQRASYEPGYVMYDKLGEAFVYDLFSNPPTEWLIRPPAPDAVKNSGVLPAILKVEADNALVKAIPFVGTKEEVTPYMAYGSNMSSSRIRERLNWVDAAGKESLDKTSPKRCVLENYRLAFNCTSTTKPNEGMANLLPEANSRVEGVLYQLPKTANEFLDKNEPGYHSVKVKVKVPAEGDKETEALVFMADADKVGPEMPPSLGDLTSIVEGAIEHGLSQAYVEELRKLMPAPTTPEVVTPTGNGTAKV